MKDTKTGTVAKCTTVTLGGTLQIGSGLPGTGIGTVTSASFGGCTIATITVSVAVQDLPWTMDALSYNTATAVTTGELVGIELVATAPGCSATLQGTTAVNGFTKFTYTDSTAKLKLLGPGGNLEAANVSGCLGLVNNGDTLQAAGGGPAQPTQVIDDPTDVGTVKVKVGTKKPPALYPNLPGEGTFKWQGNPPLGIWVRQPGQLPQDAQPPGVKAAPTGTNNDIIEIRPPATGWPDNPGKYQVIGTYTDGNNKTHNVIATLEIVP